MGNGEMDYIAPSSLALISLGKQNSKKFQENIYDYYRQII